MATAADNLPVELLLECLHAADLPTRVCASLVSRRWRTVALDDARLWDCFSCTLFRDQEHQNAMFDMLQAMLLRSRSLPFRLRIPHRYFGTAKEYEKSLLEIIQLDIRRLSGYAGPAVVFAHINPDRILPAMTSLNVLDVLRVTWTIIVLDREFSSRLLPNLEVLHAHYVSFSSHSAPFLALRDLTCSAGYAFNFQELFHLCPNLVNVTINELDADLRLPTLALPETLQLMALRPEQDFVLNIPRLLHNWTHMHLPRLVLHEAASLKGVLPRFVALHQEHRVELRLHSSNDALTLSAVPDDDAPACAWTIAPSPVRADFLRSLETPICPRLETLSVPMAQLCLLFTAKFYCPGLVRLEFRLRGKLDWPLIQAHDDQFFIRTPRLQHVVFTTNAARADMDEMHRALGVLRASFRTLIRYEAQLLDSLTLSAPAAIAQAMDCADFARFSKEYTICVTA